MRQLFISYTIIVVLRLCCFAGFVVAIKTMNQEYLKILKRFQNSLDSSFGMMNFTIWCLFMFSLKNIQISLDIENQSPKYIIRRIKRLRVKVWASVIMVMLMSVIYFVTRLVGYYTEFNLRRLLYRISIETNVIFMFIVRCVIIYLIQDFTKMILSYGSIIFKNNRVNRVKMRNITILSAALMILILNFRNMLHSMLILQCFNIHINK